MTAAMPTSITELIAARSITEVLHFTTNFGVVGCLAAGLVLPRNRLREEQSLRYVLKMNATFRAEENETFDKTEDWIDYINLTIGEISTNLFRASKRWHAASDVSWYIMAFDPFLMADAGVYFSTTNNIYPLTKRAQGLGGLQALFAPYVGRRGSWTASRVGRPKDLPTCEQAEVLYPSGLPMGYLRKVYVREGDDADWAYSALNNVGRGDVTICIEPKKFLGRPN
jgi:hypothetical protein